MSGQSPTVLLISDHLLWREGLHHAMGSRFPKLRYRQAASGCEALHSGAALECTLLLSDWALPDMDAFHLLKELRRQRRAPPTIVFAAPCQPARAIEPEGLLTVLSAQASLGELWQTVERLLPQSRERCGACVAGTPLTGRQTEVLCALQRGLANKQICAELGMADATLKTHLRALFKKYGVNNRTACVLAAQSKPPH